MLSGFTNLLFSRLISPSADFLSLQKHVRMIKSMTGYGKASAQFGAKKITAEIKALNSKGLDAMIKTSSLYREKEAELRGLLSEKVIRGKVDLVLFAESDEEKPQAEINIELARDYHRQLQELADATGTAPVDFISLIMRMPDILNSRRQELSEEEWKVAQVVVAEALKSFDAFRMQEGGHLESDLLLRIANIQSLQKEIEAQAGDRIELVKSRLKEALASIEDNSRVDQNRFEQELIYYLEKFDITEELVRLQNHCNYFKETLNETAGQGKKLGFISQEIGREINTLGSKANHAGIQRLVVQMKDELEKIKEQVLNIM